jgi:RNA polymerase sigma-70 factor (sigma-E family)
MGQIVAIGAERGRGTRMDDDEADFRDFVTTRWSSLVATAYLITTDRGLAEDCVQDALTRVHRHWRRVRRDGKPAAYAHQAVVNAALSWRRRRRVREVPLSPADHPSTLSDPARPGLSDLDAALLAALRSLPPRMRAAVALRYLEDRSEAETARLLGCSIGTVKSSASRGVARLRDALEDPADPAPAPADKAGRSTATRTPPTAATTPASSEGARS